VFDRLVHPSVACPRERRTQGRLLGALFGAPLILAGALVQVAVPHLGLPVALAMMFGATGLSWCCALALVARGRNGLVEATALACLTIAAVGVTVLAGGPGTAFGILLSVPVIEACLHRPSIRSFRIGAGASAVAIVSATALIAWNDVAAPAPSVWHWLVPVLYAFAVWLRARPLFEHPESQVPVPAIGADAGVVLDASGMAAELVGQPDLDSPWNGLVGRPLVECVNVADRVALLRGISEARASGQPAVLEIRLNGGLAGVPSGLFELVLTPHTAQQLIASFRDMAPIEALRCELEAARGRLDGNDSTKNRFLATMSHELRTPLNSIIGFSEVLEREMLGSFSDPRQKEYVELIRKSGIHLLSIVNSILDVSKIEAGTYLIYRERFALGDLVKLAVSMVEPQAQAKSIEISAKIDPAVGDVHLDRRATLQILLNLLSNAVKFTPAGGNVEIDTMREGTLVRLSVADNGIGIAPADLDRIGNPFVQVENDYSRHHEGTGLGLSLVKGLVALHQGEMSIESAPGQGTTVTLAFNSAPQAQLREISAIMQANRDDEDRKAKGHEILRKSA